MQDLIKIERKRIGETDINSVNARELWGYLESRQKFADWIKNRIQRYDFIENIDYTCFPNIMKGDENGFGNRFTKEYIITLDMAKELSMVENNTKGKQARKYFIEIEKKYREQPNLIPDNDEGKLELISNQALLLIDKIKEIRLLEASNNEKNKIIEKQTPAVEFSNNVKLSTNTMMIGTFGKIIPDCGPNILFSFLRQKGVLISEGERKNQPHQKYLKAGYFKIVEKTSVNFKTDEPYTYTQTRITGKGQLYVHRLWKEEHGINELRLVL